MAKKVDIYYHSQRRNYHSCVIIPKEFENLEDKHLRALAMGWCVMHDNATTNGHYLKFDDVRILDHNEF